MKWQKILFAFLLMFASHCLAQPGLREVIIVDVAKSSIENRIDKPESKSFKNEMFIEIKGYEQGDPITIQIGNLVINENEIEQFKRDNDYVIGIDGSGVIQNMQDPNKIRTPFELQITYKSQTVLETTVIGRTESPSSGSPSPTGSDTDQPPENSSTEGEGTSSTSRPLLLDSISPFNDAFALQFYIERKNKKVLTVLGKYAGTKINSIQTAKGIFSERDNPFIHQYIKDITELSEVELQSVSEPPKGLGGLPSPTAIFDALGTFIAQRFKQELNIAYLDEFRKRLGDQRELQLLFPKTHMVFLNNDPYKFSTYLTTLRESFEEDLRNSLFNITEFLKTKEPDVEEEKKQTFMMVLLGLELASSAKSATHPADVIDSLNVRSFIGSDPNTNFKSAIKLLALISRNLRAVNLSDGWIKPNELGEFKENKVALELFAGLVFARESKNLKEIFFGGKSLKDLILPEASNGAFATTSKMDDFTDYIESLAAKISIVQEHISMLKDKRKQGDKLTFVDYNSYLVTAVDVVEIGLDISMFVGADASQKVQEIISFAKTTTKTTLEISENVTAKQYGLALVNSVALINTVLPNSKFKTEIIEYGNFMVAVVNAKSSQEIVQALEVAALPVGSYRIKRSSKFSVSFNSYAGLSGAYEVLKSSDEHLDGKDAFRGIFAAPIGLAINFGNVEKTGDNGWSCSLFVPVIDLGAVVSFRLGDDQDALPELNLNNVIAPGGYLVFGFKNTPISLGLGVQRGPKVRKISEGQVVLNESNSLRFGGFLAVDIPIFNFYTKP